ncbi:hypothetical protein thsrh120_63210 [Rhizobium sp. No.120]
MPEGLLPPSPTSERYYRRLALRTKSEYAVLCSFIQRPGRMVAMKGAVNAVMERAIMAGKIVGTVVIAVKSR